VRLDEMKYVRFCVQSCGRCVGQRGDSEICHDNAWRDIVTVYNKHTSNRSVDSIVST
jgi:hypothetical protein